MAFSALLSEAKENVLEDFPATSIFGRPIMGVAEGEYDAFRSPEFTFSSSWSERHVAYAAGLGNFGLNGCLITSLGTSVRFASLVTSLPLEVTVEKRSCALRIEAFS